MAVQKNKINFPWGDIFIEGLFCFVTLPAKKEITIQRSYVIIGRTGVKQFV